MPESVRLTFTFSQPTVTHITGHSDGMTSAGSTSGYSADELERFISYIERVESVGKIHGYSAHVVG